MKLTRAIAAGAVLLLLVSATPWRENRTAFATLDKWVRHCVREYPIPQLTYRQHVCLVYAIIRHESNGFVYGQLRNDKGRLEKQEWFTNAQHRYGLYDKKWYYSVGWMQVLMVNARIEYGWNGTLEQMMSTSNNIHFGCRLLQGQWRKSYKRIQSGIAAYNAGCARLDGDGNYKNQRYVDDVYKWYVRYMREE